MTARDNDSVLDLIPFDESRVRDVIALWDRAVGPVFPLREALFRQ